MERFDSIGDFGLPRTSEEGEEPRGGVVAEGIAHKEVGELGRLAQKPASP
jgi:hypothetical protein